MERYNGKECKRLHPIHVDEQGLPKNGQVFSVVETRECVWVQREQSNFGRYSYTAVFVIPEKPSAYFAGAQPYIKYRSVSQESEETVLNSLEKGLKDDVRLL